MAVRPDADRPTTALAEFVSRLTFDSIPEATRQRAKEILLDSVACALAADIGEETPMVAAAARAFGDGTSTVIGAAETRSLAGAVLLNGFRITAITSCDVFTPAHCHMTPEVIPPALAMAEARGATGSELVTAVAAGLETAARVAMGIVNPEFRRRRWHAPGVVGPFGGAAAAALLMKLDPAATRNALAIAGSQAAGTYVSHGTPTVKLHQATGALAGLKGALLAAEKFIGAIEVLANPDGGLFATYAGGGDSGAVVGHLGERWEFEGISLRAWPGGTNQQPPMTAAHELARNNNIDFDRIERVTVRVAPSVFSSQVKYSKPTGTFESLSSIQYTTATVLRYGTAQIDQFTAEFYADPAMKSFVADRMDLVADDSINNGEATVEVLMADGTRYDSVVKVAKGHPDNWVAKSDLVAKAHDFGDRNVGAKAVDELIERILGLEDENDLSRVYGLMRNGR
jgi:2-methylcitrate dehydratase PrpD